MATTRRQRLPFPLVPLLLSLLVAAAYGRLISDGSPSAPGSFLSSPASSAVIRLSSPTPTKAEEKCEQSYGFLPCTTTVLGNLFLVLAYGFLMFKAATYLSAGSELLLEIMGPGLIGGLLLPILGALPDALLVLVPMESKEAHDQDVLVDLEKGNYLLIREDSNGTDVNLTPEQARAILNGTWNDLIAWKDDHHMPCCSSLSQDCAAKTEEDRTSEGEMKVGLLDNSASNKERKKRFKKPPRPPRPPITLPLDAADQKLINELFELAMLKRARIERTKALKKMKNSKPASSFGNLGVFSRHGASINFFHGPPILSVGRLVV